MKNPLLILWDGLRSAVGKTEKQQEQKRLRGDVQERLGIAFGRKDFEAALSAVQFLGQTARENAWSDHVVTQLLVDITVPTKKGKYHPLGLILDHEAELGFSEEQRRKTFAAMLDAGVDLFLFVTPGPRGNVDTLLHGLARQYQPEGNLQQVDMFGTARFEPLEMFVEHLARTQGLQAAEHSLQCHRAIGNSEIGQFFGTGVQAIGAGIRQDEARRYLQKLMQEAASEPSAPVNRFYTSPSASSPTT